MSENRMARFERMLSLRACPGCGKKRLVARKPRNYKLVRCMNCGRTMAFR